MLLSSYIPPAHTPHCTQDAFLALSASLASYYFFLSSVRAMVRNTSLHWLGTFLATFQFVVVPACLLVVFNVYSPPS